MLSYLIALVVNYNIDILNYWHPKYTKYTNQKGKKDFLMLDLGRRRSLFLKMTIPQLLNKYLKSNLKDYKHVEGMNWCIGSRVSLEKLKMPNIGFTTNYLSNASNLGQACCYVRPIQRDIEGQKIEDKVELINFNIQTS